MFVKHPNAVVFGLDSFWQGLDVPGEHLRNLMIMRLPFDPPNNPLVRANVEWEKERLRKRLPHLSDAAISGIVFKSFQVPRAVLQFRQGFGRLIRSEQDKGLITVFDPRIATQAYGEKFLAALPSDIPVVRDWETAKKVVEDLGIGNAAKKSVPDWRPRPAAMAIGA
jgi:ATP-dependent DNA helicase DinG